MLAMRKNKTQKDLLLGILMILANTLNQKIIPMKQKTFLLQKKVEKCTYSKYNKRE
jgi:hypothetical protein